MARGRLALVLNLICVAKLDKLAERLLIGQMALATDWLLSEAGSGREPIKRGRCCGCFKHSGKLDAPTSEWPLVAILIWAVITPASTPVRQRRVC
jgi:hypothetical protein